MVTLHLSCTKVNLFFNSNFISDPHYISRLSHQCFLRFDVYQEMLYLRLINLYKYNTVILISFSMAFCENSTSD